MFGTVLVWAHPEGSARPCAFLSLVLSAARSQFSCFTQRCTDPQVGLHGHRANVDWGGLPRCALAQGLDCAQTRARSPSVMVMGGKFDPVPPSSSLAIARKCHFWFSFESRTFVCERKQSQQTNLVTVSANF